MGKLTRIVLAVVGVVIVLILIAALVVPMLLNADAFRTRIEASLTQSLGRKVTIGKLELSLLSGGLLAENAVVADDPRFSTLPFIDAASVKIGVEILPLLLSRQVHIRSFTLQSPKVQVIRAANGTWNYSTIGANSATPAARTPDANQTLPDVSVAHIDVTHGRVTVTALPAAGVSAAPPSRIYDQVNLAVTDFSFAKSFPFTVSAHLPGDGTVDLKGAAGPINQQDASATPFSGHLELKHIDPLASGFVDASDGVSGLIEGLTLDAAWSGQQMHVTKLLVDTPHLTIARSNAPKAPKAANPEGTTMLHSLAVDSAEIKNGAVTLTTVGQSGPPAVYQQLNAKLTNLAPTTSSPIIHAAQLPGGGTLAANGTLGPINFDNNAATPLAAQVALKHVELETSGILAPDAGISGMTDLNAQIQSNGQLLNATGTAHVEHIKLAKNGTPSARPVDAQFAIAQNEQALTGQIQHATITVGAAAVALSGTYQSSGPTTAINLKVDGNAMPINELEAFLPALGVHLPQGSRLQGGTLTANLTVSGSSAAPVISGPVRLDNTQLAGFDLGSKLTALSKFTGGRIGSATGSGTNIRSLSMDLTESSGAIRTDKVALDVVGVGTATGAGTVSAAGALNYNVLLKLTGLTGSSSAPAAAPTAGGGGIAGLAGLAAGFIPGGAGGAAGLGAAGGIATTLLRNGVPVQIGGTTSNPTFAPNIGSLVSGAGLGAVKSFTSGKTTKGSPASQGQDLQKAIGGLFGHH
jgi:hypothetical protein